MVHEEVEVKFLNIDSEAIQKKLAEIDAKKVGEYFYRRQVFDYPGFPLDKKAAWVRLRDEGDKIMLTFKQRLGVTSHDGSTSDEGMKEVELVVSDFEKTDEFLRSIGMIHKFYQENKRIRWMKDNIEFDIDTWPKLDPYLEIEAPTWEKVDEAVALLGLDPADKKIFSTHQIYKMNGIYELDYTRMAFDGFVKRENA
ncbi:MAG: class IV adenylate cyclase [Candidatus Jorgensenbacteria bacterium]|nr:class IV adenylate cyclase [Candidatus Jorgensenbacteria bacterium]